jgi:di/tricarboxylate transporter
MAESQNDKASIRETIGWLFTLILPPAVYFISHSKGLSVQGALFTALLTGVILMWVFTLVDDYIPPLIGMFGSMFFGLAPPSIALSGMASPSLLTLMGVFALAAVIGSSGLSRRLVLYLLLKLPDRFVWQQNILVFCGLLLSLVSPSGNSRVTLLIPLFKEISDALQLAKRGVAITSLMVATYGGAMLFSTALSNSKSASIAALSILPAHLQNQYLGLFWIMAAGIPMVVLVLIHLVSVMAMFPTEAQQSQISKQTIRETLQSLGKLSSKERIAAIAFIFFFVGSMTGDMHHINTPSIAGLTILLLLLAGAFTKADFQKSIDWPMIFFMLGMDSIMRTMDYLGLDRQMSGLIGTFYAFVDGSFLLFVLATLVTTVILRLAFPVAAGMLLSFIILLPVAIGQGYSPWICLFLTAIFSDIWFFRYQNSIYLIVWNSDAVLDYNHAWFMRHNLIMNLARVLCVLAAIPLWKWMSLI